MKRPWYDFLYVRSPLAKLGFALLGVLGAIAILVWWGAAVEDKRMVAQTANWEGRSIEKGAELYMNNCASCHGIDGKGATGVAPALHSRYFFQQRLTDVGFTGTLRDYVRLTVAAGRPSIKKSQWVQMMPTWSSRFGGPMRDDQVEHVTNFVLNWEGDAITQGPPENPDPWQHFENSPFVAVDGIAAPVEDTATTDIPAEPRLPQDLFISMACASCHNINEVQSEANRGPIAPHLGGLYEVAATRVAGEDATTYVKTSIVNPTAFVAEAYAPLMPADFTAKMSEEEIDALVAWILDTHREQ